MKLRTIRLHNSFGEDSSNSAPSPVRCRFTFILQFRSAQLNLQYVTSADLFSSPCRRLLASCRSARGLMAGYGMSHHPLFQTATVPTSRKHILGPRRLGSLRISLRWENRDRLKSELSALGIFSVAPMRAPQGGTFFRSNHGWPSVEKLKFGRLLVCCPSPGFLSRRSFPVSCRFGFMKTSIELRGERNRTALDRMFKLSMPFRMAAWSQRKGKQSHNPTLRALAAGVRCRPMSLSRGFSIQEYQVVASCPLSLVNKNNKLIVKRTRGIRAWPSRNYHRRRLSNVRPQAEGQSFPQNAMLVDEDKHEKQMWSSGQGEKYLAVGYGWRVRDALLGNLDELQRVADIQTNAFHVPVAAFDELFYKLFHGLNDPKASEKTGCFYTRIRVFLAEMDSSNFSYMDDLQSAMVEEAIVGAVDVTAQMDKNVVPLLPGAYEYLYVSGMAVDSAYRRRKVATLLLEACVTKALGWGFPYLVLHAYEDDVAARTLYSRAGFSTVGGDPVWMTKFLGRRRRVIMARRTELVYGEAVEAFS